MVSSSPALKESLWKLAYAKEFSSLISITSFTGFKMYLVPVSRIFGLFFSSSATKNRSKYPFLSKTIEFSPVGEKILVSVCLKTSTTLVELTPAPIPFIVAAIVTWELHYQTFIQSNH